MVTNTSNPVANAFILRNAMRRSRSAGDITSTVATLQASHAPSGVISRSNRSSVHDCKASAGWPDVVSRWRASRPWPPSRRALRPCRCARRRPRVLRASAPIARGRCSLGRRSTTNRSCRPRRERLGQHRPPPCAELAVRRQRGAHLQAVLGGRIVECHEAEQARHHDHRRCRPPARGRRKRGDIEPAPHHTRVPLPRRQRGRRLQ